MQPLAWLYHQPTLLKFHLEKRNLSHNLPVPKCQSCCHGCMNLLLSATLCLPSSLAGPFFLRNYNTLIMSPLVSDRAFLQSIIPAPISSRNCFARAGDTIELLQFVKRKEKLYYKSFQHTYLS